MELMNWLLVAILFVAGLAFNPVTGKFFPRLFGALRLSFFPERRTATSPAAAAAPPLPERDGVMESRTREEAECVFASFDKNRDGFLSKQEILESLHNLGIPMTEKDIADEIERLDANGDGLVDLDEFCVFFESLMSREEEEREGGREAALKEAFDVFDRDGDGLITVEELGRVLGSFGLNEGRKTENCREMIEKVDMDGDGMVSFDEFKRMMRGGGRLVSAF